MKNLIINIVTTAMIVSALFIIADEVSLMAAVAAFLILFAVELEGYKEKRNERI